MHWWSSNDGLWCTVYLSDVFFHHPDTNIRGSKWNISINNCLSSYHLSIVIVRMLAFRVFQTIHRLIEHYIVPCLDRLDFLKCFLPVQRLWFLQILLCVYCCFSSVINTIVLYTTVGHVCADGAFLCFADSVRQAVKIQQFAFWAPQKPLISLPTCAE